MVIKISPGAEAAMNEAMSDAWDNGWWGRKKNKAPSQRNLTSAEKKALTDMKSQGKKELGKNIYTSTNKF